MRRLFVPLLLVAASGAGAAEPHAGETAAASPGYAYKVQRISDRVHVIAQAEPFHVQPLGNVTVIEQADGLVLVDSGGSPASGERLAGLVRAISAKPVKTIILTHWHPDHVLGASALLRHWPAASLLATAATRSHLLGPDMSMYPQGDDPARETALQGQLRKTAEALAAASARPELSAEEQTGLARTSGDVRAHAADLRGARLVPPAATLVDGLVLDDPDAPIEIVVPGPANTDGDAMVWLPRQRIIVTGDIVVAPIPFGFDAHPASWIAALDRLGRMGFSHLVPGHGAVQTDMVHASRIASYLEQVRERVAALRSQGTPAGEIAGEIDLSDQVEAIAAGDPWLRRWAKSYWATPIAASAAVEAGAQ